MHYEGDIYRPPSEARSLIIQVTVGCSHNGCTFCSMSKKKTFRVKSYDTVLADLTEARSCYRHIERIFFADGDAMCMTTDELLRLLNAVRELFPECTRVGIYSRAANILSKSSHELLALRAAGLGIVYIGAESGSPEILRRINKGDTREEIIEAVRAAEAVDIRSSVTFISGLGGSELMREHAEKTGEMITSMGASYVGLLTLVITPDVPMYKDAESSNFKYLTKPELLEELEIILEHTDCKSDSVLRSNHASNWLALKGTLPRDKDRMLSQIRAAKADMSLLRTRGGRDL